MVNQSKSNRLLFYIQLTKTPHLIFQNTFLIKNYEANWRHYSIAE